MTESTKTSESKLAYGIDISGFLKNRRTLNLPPQKGVSQNLVSLLFNFSVL